MALKAPPENLDHAVWAYMLGQSCESAAAQFHLGANRLRDHLQSVGVWRDRAASEALGHAKGRATRAAARKVMPPEVVPAYTGGLSENACAKLFGVSRTQMHKWLVATGITLRDLTTANRASSALRTPEQNRRNSEAAHAATRGRPVALSAKLKHAATVEGRRLHVSPAEVALEGWLAAMGIVTTVQKAVGPYNVDIAAGTVAVEVFGGGWHASGHHRRRSHERTRYILDAGWTLVIVWVVQPGHPLQIEAAEYVRALVEQASRDPSIRGQHRVIWGDGEDCTADRPHLDDIPHVPPTRRAAR